eukprot:176104-Amphidinium_carterae.1
MDDILRQGQAGHGSTGGAATQRGNTDAIQTLARLAMRTHQNVGYLEQAMQLEMQLHDGTVHDQLLGVRRTWESSGEKVSLRSLTHAALLKSLESKLSTGTPEQVAQFRKLTTYDAKQIDMGLVRLCAKHPTPKTGFPWTFGALFSQTNQGLEMAAFWRQVYGVRNRLTVEAFAQNCDPTNLTIESPLAPQIIADVIALYQYMYEQIRFAQNRTGYLDCTCFYIVMKGSCLYCSSSTTTMSNHGCLGRTMCLSVYAAMATPCYTMLC